MEGPSSKFLFGKEIEKINVQICPQLDLGPERKRVYVNLKFKDIKEYMQLTFYLTTRHREHKQLRLLLQLTPEMFIGYGHQRGDRGASKKTLDAYMVLIPDRDPNMEDTYSAMIQINDVEINIDDICPEKLNKRQLKTFIAGGYWYSEASTKFDLEAYVRSLV